MFQILQAEVSFQSQQLATPLKLSRGVIEELTQATVSVVGEANGRRVTGRGTIYLSDVWAWPEASLTHEQRDAALRKLCECLAVEFPKCVGNSKLHPLKLGLRLHQLACRDLTIALDPPSLASAMCASPFDAAIHDAAGQAIGRSAFELYDEIIPSPAADAYFADGCAFAAIRDIIQPARLELPAWYVVGAEEALDTTLVPAIRRHGYRWFKLKLTGRDNTLDVARTVEVYRAVKEQGASDAHITIDTNEANPSVESVVDYLERLQATDQGAFSALMYLEQPMSRDIRKHPVDWRPVARYVPVMIDEGLTDFLKKSGIEHVLLIGYATDMCFCKTTAGYENLSQDFNVFLVGDATLATFPANNTPKYATNAHISFAALNNLITQTSWIQLRNDARTAAAE